MATTTSDNNSEASIVKNISKNNVIHLHFYFHEIFDTTSVVVATNKANPNSNFGSFSIFDDELRIGPESTSKLVGKAQGFDATMMDESITLPLNFVFNKGPYKGSTLALFGRVDKTYFAERIVIGGTGQFRGARGYAISKLVATPTEKYIVVEFDVYVKCDYDFMSEE